LRPLAAGTRAVAVGNRCLRRVGHGAASATGACRLATARCPDSRRPLVESSVGEARRRARAAIPCDSRPDRARDMPAPAACLCYECLRALTGAAGTCSGGYHPVPGYHSAGLPGVARLSWRLTARPEPGDGDGRSHVLAHLRLLAPTRHVHP